MATLPLLNYDLIHRLVAEMYIWYFGSNSMNKYHYYIHVHVHYSTFSVISSHAETKLFTNGDHSTGHSHDAHVLVGTDLI